MFIKDGPQRLSEFFSVHNLRYNNKSYCYRTVMTITNSSTTAPLLFTMEDSSTGVLSNKKNKTE